ncbi:hypothetical protein [Rosistilla oblonga]|uniref:hypothetical protein n=1 Tax=Rosistilla oblonga TaxID=2527990 RepID=UPI003A9731F9
MAHSTINPKDGVDDKSPKERFLDTLAIDRSNGLKDVKFFRNSNGANSSNDVYAEINEMWSAEVVEETEAL